MSAGQRAVSADEERESVIPPLALDELGLPIAILGALALAEYITASIDVRPGLILHALILVALVILGAQAEVGARRELCWSLTLAPMIRIGSLALPLGQLPLLSWYPLIGVPIFTAAFYTAYRLGYTRAQLGLGFRFRDIPVQMAMLPLGMVLGIGEYLIFRPAPIAQRFTLEEIWLPAVILLLFTGLEEELIFRGIMQRASLRAMGRWGLIYLNLIFAVLHIGYQTFLDVVFVFLVGLMFSLFVLRTKTIWGVTIAHGGVNVVLFLLFPYLAPVLLGTGYADLLPLPAPEE